MSGDGDRGTTPCNGPTGTGLGTFTARSFCPAPAARRASGAERERSASRRVAAARPGRQARLEVEKKVLTSPTILACPAGLQAVTYGAGAARGKSGTACHFRMGTVCVGAWQELQQVAHLPRQLIRCPS